MVALLSVAIFGCGSSKIKSTPLTVREYAKQCAAYRVQSVVRYDSNFEAVSAVKYMIDGIRSIAPLPEVVKVHHALLKMLDELVDTLMEQPPDDSPDLFFYDSRYPSLYTAERDYNESQHSLSLEDREHLISEGCITRRAF